MPYSPPTNSKYPHNSPRKEPAPKSISALRIILVSLGEKAPKKLDYKESKYKPSNSESYSCQRVQNYCWTPPISRKRDPQLAGKAGDIAHRLGLFGIR